MNIYNIHAFINLNIQYSCFHKSHNNNLNIFHQKINKSHNRCQQINIHVCCLVETSLILSYTCRTNSELILSFRRPQSRKKMFDLYLLLKGIKVEYKVYINIYICASFFFLFLEHIYMCISYVVY